MTEITMPKLSDTMTEGRLGAWKKSIGDRVERGEIIAEVETDKAVMELEAFASGILLETRIKAGELVAVGTVIGVIGTAGEVAAVSPGYPMEAVEPPLVPVIPSVSQEVGTGHCEPWDHLNVLQARNITTVVRLLRCGDMRGNWGLTCHSFRGAVPEDGCSWKTWSDIWASPFFLGRNPCLRVNRAAE